MVTRSCQPATCQPLCAPAKEIPECPNVNISFSTSVFPFHRWGHWPREEVTGSGLTESWGWDWNPGFLPYNPDSDCLTYQNISLFSLLLFPLL